VAPSSKHNLNYIVEGLLALLATIGNAAKEVALGIQNQSLNWTFCLSFVVIANTISILAFDVDIADFLGVGKFYVDHPMLGLGLYLFLAIFGFFLWGVVQGFRKRKILGQLRTGLVHAGLKNRQGKYPNFVSDHSIDGATRKLTLSSSGIPIKEFRDKKEALETSLRIFIDEFRERREKGLMDVLYAHEPMPTRLETTTIPTNQPYIYPIGSTRSKKIQTDFRKSPHLLIAGQSGGGKSTLVRNIFTSLYLNHKHAKFALVDLKEGTEFQIFENLDRVKIIENISETLSSLTFLDKTMTQRMDTIRKAGCKDIEEYVKAKASTKKRLAFMPRQFIIIDESSEFELQTRGNRSDEVIKAKKALSRIARMGRACGVHLILATQRPDKNAIDSQVKANLTNIVCFAVPNIPTSMTILSSARAASLPSEIKGRGIWKDGGLMVEIQCPYISSENINKWLAPFRTSKKPKESAKNPDLTAESPDESNIAPKENAYIPEED